MSPVPSRLDRFLPPTPLARRLSMQSILFAFGEGAFLTGSAVFFTQIVGPQRGPGRPRPDRRRRRVVLLRRAARQARRPDRPEADVGARGGRRAPRSTLVWPFISGLRDVRRDDDRCSRWSTPAGWSGRGAYTIDVFPREERVQSLAFMRAALNIGFTFGALIGGLALAFDSDAVDPRRSRWLTAGDPALQRAG